MLQTSSEYKNQVTRTHQECNFLLQNGKIIAIVRGVNAPLISKKITELVQEEREIAAGRKERTKVLTKHINEYFYSTYMAPLSAHHNGCGNVSGFGFCLFVLFLESRVP